MAATTLSIALFFSYFCCCSLAELFLTVPPSYGDIIVTKNGQILYISLAPDNIEVYNYTFPVCGSYINSCEDVGKVISAQLGYKTCTCERVEIFRAPVIAFVAFFGAGGINCTGKERHIMQCNILNPMTSFNNCDHFIQVNCKKDDSLYKLSPNSMDKFYDGQVILYPPSPSNRDNATSSMGLVVMKEVDYCSKDSFWGFMNVISDKVDLSVANTICQMNGFARVSSILTKKKAEEIFRVSFSELIEESKSHLTYNHILNTSDINCGELSQPCLRCCNYKFYDCFRPLPNDHSINTDSLLVLRCTFNLGKSYWSDDITDCETISNQASPYCTDIHFKNLQLHGNSDQSNHQYQGRLEYYWNFKWHTVCSTSFSDHEADLVCKKMGHYGAESWTNQPKYDGEADAMPIVSIQCSNNSQTSCIVSTTGASSCNHDVYLKCKADYDWKEISLIIAGVAGFIIATLIIIIPIIILQCKSHKPAPANPSEITSLLTDDLDCNPAPANPPETRPLSPNGSGYNTPIIPFPMTPNGTSPTMPRRNGRSSVPITQTDISNLKRY